MVSKKDKYELLQTILIQLLGNNIGAIVLFLSVL